MSLAAKGIETMTLPSPKELGLPSKYRTWRPGQDTAIVDGLESPKRFVVQVQRTGKGKTATYMTQAILAKDLRVVILTANKGLQDQLVDEWADYGVVDVRGKNNYDCDGLPGHKCDEGQIAKCCYNRTMMCGYNHAVHEAREARILVTNYNCWISTNKYSQGFGEFDMMICDEAHNAPAEVAKAMRIQLSDREMELINRDWPDDQTDMKVWKEWAAVTYRIAENKVEKLKAEIDKPGTPKNHVIKDYKSLKNLTRKLADISTCRTQKWVVDMWNYGFQFDPIEAGEFSERVLFRAIPRVILTSGTIRPKTIEILDIKRRDYEFFDYPSPIDPVRSPFLQVQTGIKVNRNTQPWELRKLVGWIDRIIETRQDRKGIIHTANTRLRDFIMQHSKFGTKFGKGFMTSNYAGNGDVTSEVIKRFKERPGGGVLVSFSVTTGYDFPYDACRYQILAKAPWADLSTKLQQARMREDPQGAAYDMMQAIAQAFGRGDRAEDDWQEFFSLDENVGEALWRYSELGPSWLGAYVQNVYEIPAPMQGVNG